MFKKFKTTTKVKFNKNLVQGCGKKNISQFNKLLIKNNNNNNNFKTSSKRQFNSHGQLNNFQKKYHNIECSHLRAFSSKNSFNNQNNIEKKRNFSTAIQAKIISSYSNDPHLTTAFQNCLNELKIQIDDIQKEREKLHLEKEKKPHLLFGTWKNHDINNVAETIKKQLPEDYKTRFIGCEGELERYYGPPNSLITKIEKQPLQLNFSKNLNQAPYGQKSFSLSALYLFPFSNKTTQISGPFYFKEPEVPDSDSIKKVLVDNETQMPHFILLSDSKFKSSHQIKLLDALFPKTSKFGVSSGNTQQLIGNSIKNIAGQEESGMISQTQAHSSGCVGAGFYGKGVNNDLMSQVGTVIFSNFADNFYWNSETKESLFSPATLKKRSKLYKDFYKVNENTSICNLYQKPNRSTQLLPFPLEIPPEDFFSSETEGTKKTTGPSIIIQNEKEKDILNLSKEDNDTSKIITLENQNIVNTENNSITKTNHSIPIIFLDILAFPTQRVPLVIYEPRYRMMCKEAYEKGHPVGIFHDTAFNSLGSLIKFEKPLLEEDGVTLHITGTAFQRVELKDYWTSPATFGLNYAEIEYYNDIDPQTLEEIAHLKKMHQHVKDLIQEAYSHFIAPDSKKEVIENLLATYDPKQLSFWVASHLSAPSKTQNEWFTLSNTAHRLEKQLSVLQRYISQFKRSK